MKRSHRVSDALKRAADIIAAAVLLIVLSPVLLALAMLVRIRLGSPVIFTQSRPGKGGRLFTMYKFRTMTTLSDQADSVAALSTDADRLTPLGRTLRSTSLDELPEFLNVLRGDMSLVGPRPLLPEYLGRYNERQARRHEVRPGITGWAQVNGRNAVSWHERFEMDVWYVDNRSLLLDLRILAMTIGAVLKRRDVASSTHATMEPFEPGVNARKDEECE